jgi:hypothetical protein
MQRGPNMVLGYSVMDCCLSHAQEQTKTNKKHAFFFYMHGAR